MSIVWVRAPKIYVYLIDRNEDKVQGKQNKLSKDETAFKIDRSSQEFWIESDS